jgi:hypothetical protein
MSVATGHWQQRLDLDLDRSDVYSWAIHMGKNPSNSATAVKNILNRMTIQH